MSDHPNRAERRGHFDDDEHLEPSGIIYSKDPWDERRFDPFALRRGGRMTSWEAAAPFLLILGGAALLALAIFLVKAIAG